VIEMTLSHSRRFVSLVVLGTALAVAVLAVRATDARADKAGFECFVPARGFCVIGDPHRHIYTASAWYAGQNELLMGVGLDELGRGVWGQAKNRSNLKSLVTLDSGCNACAFQVVLYNDTDNAHTIDGYYFWTP